LGGLWLISLKPLADGSPEGIAGSLFFNTPGKFPGVFGLPAWGRPAVLLLPLFGGLCLERL